MSHSQNGEDLIVAAQFPEGFKGTLLEIGAWEPVNLSNSRMLIERGWSAVLCEFSPGPVAKLVKEYSLSRNAETGEGQRIDVIAAAITPNDRHVEEFSITDDALSTADPAQLRIWQSQGGYYGKLWVPTLHIHDLLSQFFGDRACDFASIDVEGPSVDLAIALMQTDHWPKVLVVEHNNRMVELMAVAQARRYKCIHLNPENAILCHE